MGKGNYASSIRKLGKSYETDLTKPNIEGDIVQLLRGASQLHHQSCVGVDDRVVENQQPGQRNMCRIDRFHALFELGEIPLPGLDSDFEASAASSPDEIFPCTRKEVLIDVDRSRPRRPVERLYRNALVDVNEAVSADVAVPGMIFGFDGVVDATFEKIVFKDGVFSVIEIGQTVEAVVNVAVADCPVSPDLPDDAGLVGIGDAVGAALVNPPVKQSIFGRNLHFA